MRRFLKTTAVFILFPLIILPFAFSWASGKMEAVIGEKIELSAQSEISGASYKWNVVKNGEIINTQAKPKFEYAFLEEGDYEINLMATGASERVDATKINVKVRPAPNYKPSEKIEAVLDTIPGRSSDGNIYLFSDPAKVTFFAGNSLGAISEYQIDRNKSYDADFNPFTINDVDNRGTDSHLFGTNFETTYSRGEGSSFEAVLTVIGADGSEDSDSVKIIFSDKGKEKPSSKLKAVLKTLPPIENDGKIHITGNKGTVSFYAGESLGNIKEYRIDKNINFDTGGDLILDNDIDNASDPSFITGESFLTDFDASWGDIVVRLNVVSESGEEDKEDIAVVFDERKKKNAQEQLTSDFAVDMDRVYEGEKVSYLSRSYGKGELSLKWDFDGDGIVDKEEKTSPPLYKTGISKYQFNKAGIYTSILTVIDKDGNAAEKTKKIIVEKLETETEGRIRKTIVDFTYAIKTGREEKAIVFFKDKSTASRDLEDKTLEFLWDFGDGEISREEDPQHVYKNISREDLLRGKNYIVTLTIKDSSGAVRSKSEEITIKNKTEKNAVAASTGSKIEPDSNDNLPPAGNMEKNTGKNIIKTIIKSILAAVAAIIAAAAVIIIIYFLFMHKKRRRENIPVDKNCQPQDPLKNKQEINGKNRAAGGKENIPAQQGVESPAPVKNAAHKTDSADTKTPAAPAGGDAGNKNSKQPQADDTLRPPRDEKELDKKLKDGERKGGKGPVPDWLKR